MWTREDKGRRYVCWKENGKQRRRLESRWVWEQANGDIPAGHHIHHRDGNRLNNELSNLECIERFAHWNNHNRIREAHKTVAGIEHRQCQRCSKWKPLCDYQKRRAGTYQGYCKVCSRDTLQEWRERNRAHYNAYMREYQRRRRASA